MILFALQQQGPDSPLGNLLGYVVLFAVVIWPIIRSVIEAANEKRKEFERTQQAAGRKAAGQGAKRGRRRFEDVLAEDGGTTASVAMDGFDEPPPLRSLSKRTGSLRDPVEPERPTSLAGDLFDDRVTGFDLAEGSSLSSVPGENELESSTDGPDFDDYRPLAPGSHANAPSTQVSDVPGAALKVTRLTGTRGTPGKGVLTRLEKRLSPWQRAIALREILGPPVAHRREDERIF